MKLCIYLIIIFICYVSQTNSKAYLKKITDSKKFYCNQNYTEEEQKKHEKFVSIGEIGGKYKISKVQWYNEEEKYVRLYSDFEGEQYIIKLFLRKNLEDFFKSKDGFKIAKEECEQLKKLQELIEYSNNKNIKIEKCLEDSNIEESSSNILVFSVMKEAEGKRLSELCMVEDCRGEKLKKIILYFLQLLQVLNTEFYFQAKNINIDSIYYYEGMQQNYLTIADLQYNQFPDYQKTNRLFQKDLHDFAIVLLQILTSTCNINNKNIQHIPYLNYKQQQSLPFSFNKKDLHSPIDIFIKIHSNQQYYNDDVDVGVLIGIYEMKDYMETQDEKNIYLDNSIYHFIYKMLQGPNQFINIQDAIDHPFLQKKK